MITIHTKGHDFNYFGNILIQMDGNFIVIEWHISCIVHKDLDILNTW